jgi:purine-cytosine permease-like protein
MVPSLLTIAVCVGFGVLDSIICGQALASIADISWTCVDYAIHNHESHRIFSVGIVITSVISLFVSNVAPYVPTILDWFHG